MIKWADTKWPGEQTGRGERGLKFPVQSRKNQPCCRPAFSGDFQRRERRYINCMTTIAVSFNANESQHTRAGIHSGTLP